MAEEHPPSSELESWQQIAAYLGVSVRTAQKWEAVRGLPVTRRPGSNNRVTASRSELDRWHEATLEKPVWRDSPALLRVYVATAAGILLLQLCIAAAYFIVSTGDRRPARFTEEQDSLAVADERGRVLWRHKFDDPFCVDVGPDRITATRKTLFSDIDDDGRVETLYVYVPNTVEEVGESLFCFSEDGFLKWRFTPGRTIRAGPSTFAPPYSIAYAGVLPSKEPGESRVLVVGDHLTGFPAQVALLGPDGSVRGEYWHSGRLTAVETADMDEDGTPEIFLGGVSPGYGGATLVVLNSDRVQGSSSEPRDTQIQIPNERTAERGRIIFPRTTVNRLLAETNVVREIQARSGFIQVDVVEREIDPGSRSGPGLTYTFDLQLRPVSVEPTDQFWSLHRALETSHTIHHPLTPDEIRGLLRQIRSVGNQAPPAP